MGMQNNERNPHIETINIGAVAAAATVTVLGWYNPKRGRIKQVYLVDTALFAVSGSNYLTASLQDNSATPVVYATGNTKLGVAALTPLAIPLAAGGGQAFNSSSTTGLDSDDTSNPETDIPAGTMLNVKIVSTGTQAMVNGMMVVEWYPL